MPIIHAIVLGIVQGLTEFLPVSSSGHLLIVPWLFGWHDFNGSADLEKTFDVALHLGTFVGVVIYFRTELRAMARAVLTRTTPVPTPAGGPVTEAAARNREVETQRRLAWLLIVASIPAAVTGALFESTIDEKLGQMWLIAVMLIVFAIVLYLADRLPGLRTVERFSTRDALLMGGAQALALQPGVSRSGVTISAARVLGFNRDSAARLSFLMSLPIIGGAVLFKGVKVIGDFPSGFAWPFIAGILASGITGYAAVWVTLRIVRTHTFLPFVVYRIGLGVAILLLLASSFR
jgi:undecaprenyl-diphosphatase